MNVDIAALLREPEGPTLDFKAEGYNLSDERDKRAFAKDIASLANTPRTGDAHLVLGVKKQPDGDVELWGLNQDLDEADLQGVAASHLEPTPQFHYEAVRHGGVVLGVITIPGGQRSPVAPRKKMGDGFVPGIIYFRRGSQNSIASMQEQTAIWGWFGNLSESGEPENPYAQEPAWARYLEEVENLGSASRHLLIADDTFREDADSLAGLGAGPWSYVLDFDTASDKVGLLSATHALLDRRRALHIRVKGDPRTNRSPSVTTTWFFARGLDGRADSVLDGGFRSWRREYGPVLDEEFRVLAGELGPGPVFVTILWRDLELIDHLKEVLRSLDLSFRDLFHPVFVTEVPAICEGLASEYQAPVIEMPLRHFARGVEGLMINRQPSEGDTVSLPTKSGVNISLDSQTANRIAEEIELVHLGLPKPEEEDDSATFLRGGTVTWTDLDNHLDAGRDVQERLTSAVRSDLAAARITRFNLFHRPGAGGTTVARRLLWELHDEFPCGMLRRTDPMGTADRVALIYELTGQPVLLVADGRDISERELDDLAEQLGARRSPVVLVQVRRRNRPRPTARAFSLDSQLSEREVARFVNTLSRDVPHRRAAIEALGQSAQNNSRLPVYFALTAYERDFKALPDFVGSRIAELNEEQTEALVYAAIALHYGQRGLPVGALRPIFGLSGRENPDLSRLFPSATTELFVETSPGEWRIGHSLVAEELLAQLLARGGDRRTWRNQLADWGIRFITFCRGELAVPSDDLLDLVGRVFVDREGLDVLGREQASRRQFSYFVQDIPVSEGKLRVLESLVDAYPDQHHFWAHLARFYSLDRKDFDRAIECADKAVDLGDNDSLVYHMRGMVRRNYVRSLEQSSATIGDLVGVAEQASLDFQRCRELNPENEHGYISEAEMRIGLLRYIRQTNDDVFEYISRRDAPIYIRESLDRIEGLLAHVKRNHEGAGASEFEARASARVHELYGDYTSALQRLNSLLGRADVFQPPIRRQLAWAYLSRSRGDWSMVPPHNVDRVVELLTRNLNEEADHEENIRLWMQASRFQEMPPSLESVFEQVQYWQAQPGSVDAAYYAYVLNAVMAMDGSPVARQQYERYLEECRELTRFRRNRDRSYEWLGEGPGLSRLVHQSRLGEWDREAGFWKNTGPLTRVHGLVSRVNGPQQGFIEFPGGLHAFFVPARAQLGRGSENTPIRAFLGFSYDGPRAWDVVPNTHA